MPIRGEQVVVEFKSAIGKDAMGDMLYSFYEEQVPNVIVQPGSTDDITGSTRPDGTKVTYTLHFPKTWNKRVNGLRVKVRGDWCNVIGDPVPYTAENTPGTWNYPVQVVRSNG